MRLFVCINLLLIVFISLGFSFMMGINIGIVLLLAYTLVRYSGHSARSLLFGNSLIYVLNSTSLEMDELTVLREWAEDAFSNIRFNELKNVTVDLSDVLIDIQEYEEIKDYYCPAELDALKLSIQLRLREKTSVLYLMYNSKHKNKFNQTTG